MSFEKTYKSLEKISERVLGKDKNVFLIGGISAAIQTGRDLYRKNDDLDLMVDVKDLVDVITALKEIGYKAYDRRGIKTQNTVDMNGDFVPANHEIDINPTDEELLGIGIFTYERANGKVTTHSYAYDQREGAYIGTKKVMPEELFDLMYSSESVDYRGMQLKTSSKEFVYLSKSRGAREKDKLDADVLSPYIDEEAKKRIERINKLEKRTKVYKEIFDKNGEILEIIEEPSFSDKVYRFVENWVKQNPDVQSEELYEKFISEDRVKGLMNADEDIKKILDKLGKIKFKTPEEFAEKTRRTAELYCYSDNFEKDFDEEFLSPEKEDSDAR